jgi:hypothetical protein
MMLFSVFVVIELPATLLLFRRYARFQVASRSSFLSGRFDSG